MSKPSASPIDNQTYNLLTSLQNKLQALGAYDQYLQDAHGDEDCTRIFKQMQADDRRDVELLKAELAKHLSHK